VANQYRRSAYWASARAPDSPVCKHVPLDRVATWERVTSGSVYVVTTIYGAQLFHITPKRYLKFWYARPRNYHYNLSLVWLCDGVWVLSWLRRLVAGLSPPRSGFDLMPVNVGFVVALGQAFCEYLVFQSAPFHQCPILIHLFIQSQQLTASLNNALRPYSEAAKCSPHLHTTYLRSHFKIILPFPTRSPNFFLRFHTKFLYAFLSPPCVPYLPTT
jgi:hypothetical protein